MKEKVKIRKMSKLFMLQGKGKTDTMGMRLIDLMIPLGDPELEERWGGVGWGGTLI